MPVFKMLDDFVFLGALRHQTNVEWWDRAPNENPGMIGKSYCGNTVRRHQIQIRIVRDTEDHRSVRQVETLMHEMCHAFFQFFLPFPYLNMPPELDQCMWYEWTWTKLGTRRASGRRHSKNVPERIPVL